MANLPLGCLPKETIYYYATQITHRGKTRFNINTTLYNPVQDRYFNLKLPIESMLLYHYKTPLNQIDPTPLFNCKLTMNLGVLNKTNIEDPNVNTHPHFRNRNCFSVKHQDTSSNFNGWIIQIPKPVLARDLYFSHPYLLRVALFSGDI